jgi:uncharacterized membrane protein YvbJ
MQPTVNSKRKKKYVIVNQTRFVIASVITLILLSIIMSYITGTLTSNAESETEIIKITIREGDTLWKIASQYNYYDEDIRAVVHRIKAYNQLESANIYPQQVVMIPINN